MEEERQLERQTILSAKITSETSEQLEYLAKKAQITKSRLVANILETVVPDLVLCDKIGIWQLSYILRDMEKGLKGWVNFLKDEAREMGESGTVAPVE